MGGANISETRGQSVFLVGNQRMRRFSLALSIAICEVNKIIF